MKTSTAATNTKQGPLKPLEGSPPPPLRQGREMLCVLEKIFEAEERREAMNNEKITLPHKC